MEHFMNSSKTHRPLIKLRKNIKEEFLNILMPCKIKTYKIHKLSFPKLEKDSQKHLQAFA